MAKETEEQMQQRELIEGIASNLKELAGAVKALLHGKLNKKALFVLLANSSGESQTTIKRVLEAVESLEKDWVNK